MDIWVDHPELDPSTCYWIIVTNKRARRNTSEKKSNLIRQFLNQEGRRSHCRKVDIDDLDIKNKGYATVLELIQSFQISSPIKILFCLSKDDVFLDSLKQWLEKINIPYGILGKPNILMKFAGREEENKGIFPVAKSEDRRNQRKKNIQKQQNANNNNTQKQQKTKKNNSQKQKVQKPIVENENLTNPEEQEITNAYMPVKPIDYIDRIDKIKKEYILLNKENTDKRITPAAPDLPTKKKNGMIFLLPFFKKKEVQEKNNHADAEKKIKKEKELISSYAVAVIKEVEQIYFMVKKEYLFYSWQAFTILVCSLVLVADKQKNPFEEKNKDDLIYEIWLLLLRSENLASLNEKIKKYALSVKEEFQFYSLKENASSLQQKRAILKASKSFKPPKNIKPIVFYKDNVIKSLSAANQKLKESQNKLVFWLQVYLYAQIDHFNGNHFFSQVYLSTEERFPFSALVKSQELNHMYKELVKTEDCGEFKVSMRVGYQIDTAISAKEFVQLKLITDRCLKIQSFLYPGVP